VKRVTIDPAVMDDKEMRKPDCGPLNDANRRAERLPPKKWAALPPG